MEKRLSRFGVGPRIALSAVAYGAVALVATYAWPDNFLLKWPTFEVFAIAAAVLALFGLPLWVTAVITVMRAYNRDELLTTGVFALCRHPVYSAWILFLLPALALLSRSWPVMIAPFIAYSVFRSQIHTEDEYLQKRFGAAYRNYRARVNELLPLPKAGANRHAPLATK